MVIYSEFDFFAAKLHEYEGPLFIVFLIKEMGNLYFLKLSIFSSEQSSTIQTLLGITVWFSILSREFNNNLYLSFTGIITSIELLY